MISTLYTIFIFIVAISILITVHEFGHYWVAKKVGVKVLRFSVGFGKTIFSKQLGSDRTEFVIAAFPLGGYVKMLDESEGPVAADELDRAFNRKTLWQRSAVVVAGPLFNLLFAVLAYWAVFYNGTEGVRPIVGHVVAESPAARAGFTVGDELLAVDGRKIHVWGHQRLYLYSQVLDGSAVEFDVRKKTGYSKKIAIDLSKLSLADIGPSLIGRGLGLYVERPPVLAIIGEIKDGPARESGLQSGDQITRINDQKITAWQDMAELIHGSAGRSLAITYQRNGIVKTVTVIPDTRKIDNREIGLINIGPKYPEFPKDMIRRLQYGFVDAFAEAVDQTWQMSSMTLQMLFKMMTLEVSPKNISGPITIAQYAGQSASIGISQFVIFLAVISISLGVLNLLPIPVLDGGHLLYYGIEAIKGSPLSEQARLWGQQMGMAILLMLMILAFYNDIIRLIK